MDKLLDVTEAIQTTRWKSNELCTILVTVLGRMTEIQNALEICESFRKRRQQDASVIKEEERVDSNQ